MTTDGQHTTDGGTDQDSVSRRQALLALGGVAAGGVLGRHLPETGARATASLDLVGRDPPTVRRSGWTQTQQLSAEGRNFGATLALADEWLLVGGPPDSDRTGGRALLYRNAGESWRRATRLTGPEGSRFGVAVALGGDPPVALVGAPVGTDDESGTVGVYEPAGETWRQTATIDTDRLPDTGQFGVAVAVGDDGTTALVGTRVSGDTPESAFVFEFDGENWTETAVLTAGEGGTQEFGRAVALDGAGETAIVGTPGDDVRGFNGGGANIFRRTADGWRELTEITDNAGDSNRFGISVALDSAGQRAVAGSPVPYPDHFEAPGFVSVIGRENDRFQARSRLTKPRRDDSDNLGYAVDIDAAGEAILAGDPQDLPARGASQGSASLFVREAGGWRHRRTLSADDGSAGDRFGAAVAVGDGTGPLAIGAPSATVQGDETGAVYVFEPTADCVALGPDDSSGSESDTTRVVDDFEDGDLAEYVAAGPKENWEVGPHPRRDGERALQFQGGDGADIRSYEGLAVYPRRGDRVSFEFGTFGGWADYAMFSFGVQEPPDWQHRYELELEPANSECRLQYSRPDSETTLATETVAFERDRLYTVVIDWAGRSDRLAVQVVADGTELGRLTAVEPDGAPDSGGVGFYADDDAAWTFDAVRLDRRG